MHAAKRLISLHWVVPAVLAALTFACFADVIVRDRQFAFRDAAHHYYPLHARVQQEWSAGRIPLWDPWQNGGMPLLGNPTAAVFYPAKIIFAIMPLAWASRVYVMFHVLLAFVGMHGLLRAWRCSPVAASIGGLAYAFGGPVLLLHSNVIYLVGAAWAPFGLWSVDSWIRSARLRALGLIAATVAMPVLGGDPEASLLLVTAGFVQILAARRTDGAEQLGSTEVDKQTTDAPRPRVDSLPFTVPRILPRLRLMALIAVAWIVFSAIATVVLPAYRSAWASTSASERPMRLVVVFACIAALLALVSRRSPRVMPLMRGLAIAVALAGLLASVQVLPTLEFVAGSTRTEASAGLDRYGFSLVPYRVAEFFAPAPFGTPYPINASWRSVMPPATDPTFWIPSLYMGGLTIVLAAIAVFSPRGRLTRGLVWLVVVSLIGAFGLYAGPLGLRRWLPGLTWLPQLAPLATTAHTDFRAGDGSPYWLLSTLIPGLDLFRYPSKLLVWSALGIAALAGIGWDQSARSRQHTASMKAYWIGFAAMAAVLIPILAAGFAVWPTLFADADGGRASATTGPFQVARAVSESMTSAAHAGVVFFLTAVLLWPRVRQQRSSGPAAIALLALDLAIAQPRWIWTVPQSFFDAEPRAAAAIAKAEQVDPAEGPFRIHRPTVWHPFGWFRDSSTKRLEEIVAFERDSLQALYGLPLGYEYTFTLGILEPESHLRVFRPWLRPIGPALAPSLGLSPDERILYFPRRAFDVWNTRYFIVPVDAMNWRDENRTYASFLPNCDVIAPDVERLKQTGGMDAWRISDDWQVLRNRAALPRAWVVHNARVIEPIERLDARQRDQRIRSFLYPGDALWNEPGRTVLDPRHTAVIEAEAISDLGHRLFAPASPEAESVKITHYDPQRVEINARLTERGLVILADAHAQGWSLTIDGAPAPILRANLGMRAAVVGAGMHRLLYVYDPLSFKLGACLTFFGTLCLALLVAINRNAVSGATLANRGGTR